MNVYLGTRFRQPRFIDSRSVLAEYGDGLLDAREDAKRISMSGADGHTGGSCASITLPFSLRKQKGRAPMKERGPSPGRKRPRGQTT